jgi:hypothetical protein
MRVHTTNFAFRGEDSSVQWLVTADRANTTFGLLDFFARRVRLHDAWARGVSVRIRFKIDPAAATADYVDQLPSIAGFDDAPIKPAVMPPPITDTNYNLWTVEIDDVVGENVREVWVDTVRVVDTDGYVAGGFYLKPVRRVFVRPTECRIADGRILTKDMTISELHGTFEIAIAALDLEGATGVDMLHHLDAKAKAQAKVSDLHFLDPILRPEHVALTGGGGPTLLAVELQRGELVSGSRAWMRAEGLGVWSGRNGLTGTSLVSAVVPQGKRYLSVSVETYGFGLHRDKTSVAYAPAVAALLHLDNLDLGKPFDEWAASLNAPSVVAKSLEALNGYFDERLFFGGSGTLSAHANITPNAASGHVKVDVSNAVVDVSKTAVTLSGTAEVTVHSFDRSSGKGDLAGARLNLQGVAGGKEQGWWVNLSASPLAIAVEHGGIALSGYVTGKCKDAQLPLAILDAPGIVRGAFGRQSFTGASEFRLSHRTTDLSDLRFIGDSIEVKAHYHAPDGAAIVDTPLINVGVLIRNGETSTHPFATHEWYNRTLATKSRADRR